MNRESPPTRKAAASSDQRRDIRVIEMVDISTLVAVVGIDLLDLSDEFADWQLLGSGYVAFLGGSVAASGEGTPEYVHIQILDAVSAVLDTGCASLRRLDFAQRARLDRTVMINAEYRWPVALAGPK